MALSKTSSRRTMIRKGAQHIRVKGIAEPTRWYVKTEACRHIITDNLDNHPDAYWILDLHGWGNGDAWVERLRESGEAFIWDVGDEYVVGYPETSAKHPEPLLDFDTAEKPDDDEAILRELIYTPEEIAILEELGL